MAKITVKNEKSAGSNHPKGYASWLAYWEEQQGRKAPHCLAGICQNAAEVGAQVTKVGVKDKKVYILPVCKPCDEYKDEYLVDESDLVLVPGQKDDNV
ncbi:MAG: hypothetical protein LBQ97_05075 [Fusobacteriaceae bacterium]|jgi:hypothetical protein|nr:hypothetical protein [Fusobacteriaceae bacterium]